MSREVILITRKENISMNVILCILTIMCFTLFFRYAIAYAKTFQSSSSTMTAYNVSVEGNEFLQEGYVDKQQWQDDYDAKAAELEILHSELLELRDYLSEENRTIVDNFNLDNFKYISELEEIDAQFVTMKEEASAAKEKQLEQQNYGNNSFGLTRSSGVNYYNGRKETFYSSRILYHYRTSEWTVDSEGFYRTDEGYYVVAASDMSQGTVFQGSKGMCQVLDSGCDINVTDYYVIW